jgi:hypothetical protein
MADSGRIFATDSPFPIQKPRIPFSTYILVIALVTAFIPNDLDTMERAGSGCRVIKNIFSRSNGAVNVRETEGGAIRGHNPEVPNMLTRSSHTASQQVFHGRRATEPIVMLFLLINFDFPMSLFLGFLGVRVVHGQRWQDGGRHRCDRGRGSHD